MDIAQYGANRQRVYRGVRGANDGCFRVLFFHVDKQLVQVCLCDMCYTDSYAISEF